MSNLNNQTPRGTPTGTLLNGKQNKIYTINASDLLLGFTDADGDTLSVSSLAADSGEITLLDNDRWSFTPEMGYSGLVTLEYVVSDLFTGDVTASQSFYLTANQTMNQNPTGTASAKLVDGKQNTVYTINSRDLLQGFSDPEGDTLSVGSLSADNGELTQNGDNWTFTPDASYSGVVTLEYVVSDTFTGDTTATQTFSLVAPPVIVKTNNAPTGTPTASLANGKQSAIYTISSSDLLRGFTDADGDILSIGSLAVDNGELTQDGDKWQYLPDVNYSGVVTFEYVVTDTRTGDITATQTFSLSASAVRTNNIPTGNPTAKLPDGKQNTAYVINQTDLLQGVSDSDGDTLSISSLAADNGELTQEGDGRACN